MERNPILDMAARVGLAMGLLPTRAPDKQVVIDREPGDYGILHRTKKGPGRSPVKARRANEESRRQNRAPRRTEAQQIIQSMTNWQNHQWMKAGGSQKLSELRRFADMRMGEADG